MGVISSPPQHKAALPRGCCLFCCPSPAAHHPTLSVPRRQQFSSTGTFPLRNVPACPTRARSGTSPCPGGSNSPPREHFPSEMCPPAPTRARSGTYSVDRRLVFVVREIRRKHLPLPDCILQRGTAPSKTILFGKEHHTLPNRSPVGVADPTEFHEQPTRNNTDYYKFHT